MANDSSMAGWDPVPYPPPDQVVRQIGPLTLRLRRRDDEWQAALAYAPPDSGARAGTAPAAPPETDLTWQRWVVRDGSGGLALTPGLPDRAVVVRPRFPLVLPTQEEALFYVTVPAWIRLTAQPAGLVLLDVPSTPLSKIWYGDFAAGELGYGLKSRATRHLDDHPEVAWRITCPVQVRNQSRKALSLERLCLRVQHLGVFAGGARLWTPLVTAVFAGDEQVAEVSYGKEAPPGCHRPVALSPPRVPVAEHHFWRAFRELSAQTLW